MSGDTGSAASGGSAFFEDLQSELRALESHVQPIDDRMAPLDLLLELSKILGSRRLDRRRLLEATLDGAIRLTGADRGLIMLTHGTGELTAEVSRGRDGRSIAPEAFRFSQTITRRVLDSGELLHIPRIAPDSQLAQVHSVASMALSSVMCAPLKLRVRRAPGAPGSAERRRHGPHAIHRVLGVIYLDSLEDGRRFGDDALKVFDVLANHAAGVLASDQFREEATTDRLTGLPNRRQFALLVDDERLIARRSAAPLALGVIDLDGFRGYNERFGRQAGDALLQTVGRTLVDLLRWLDVVCRYGADRFAVLLPETDVDGAIDAMVRVQQTLGSLVTAAPGERLTIAAGLTLVEPSRPAEEAMARADQALHAAKTGERKIRVWDDELGLTGARADKLAGILTGDWATDYRNVLALLDAIGAMGATVALEELLEQALDHAVGIVSGDHGLLLLADGDQQRAVSRRHDRQVVAVDPLDEGLARQALATGQARRLGGPGQPAHLAAPLLRGEATIGALVVSRTGTATAFHENEATFFAALAQQIATAVSHALLVDTDHLQRKQIERLNEQLAARVERQTAELAQAKRELEGRYRYDQLVGRSPAMQRVFETLSKVIPSDLAVLIQGESGTGKELVAKTIHYNGPRAHARFLSENCAAISPSLLESELFGHVRGAFTGATRDKVGLFEHATGGTLFLDEIGDLELDLQAKLLRVLEEGRIRPVGQTEEREVDVRIVAASNKDLRALCEAGQFREDLYYRLAVVTVPLPPLRERREDLPELVAALLGDYATRRQAQPPKLSPDAFRLLESHAWPGNVRELRNLLEKLVVFAGGRELDAVELRHHLDPQAASAGAPDLIAETAELPFKEAKRVFERAYLERALSTGKRNISRTAQQIQVDRRYLYDLLDKHGLRE